MSRTCFSVIGAICLVFLAHDAFAQSTPVADRIIKQRRAEARSLLISLASDARSFRDQELSARSLARIADILWSVNPEQGRTLFRQSWEAAASAEQENKTRTKLRTEILSLTARRERSLAEEFLQKLKLEQQEDSLENSRNNLWALSNASEQRLNLAEKLLGLNDVERALQFSDPVLSNVTISALDFLTRLRAKDPVAADQRYASMLTNAGGNALTDANTISLLSSYIFTPRTYVTYNDSGAAENSWPASPLPPANVSAQLRQAFFQTASRVLLRTQPSSEPGASNTVTVGKYMVIKQLLPMFEQYAPRELSASMRSHFIALNTELGQAVQLAEKDWVQKEIGPDKTDDNREQPLLDQIEHAKSSEERDELYFRLALLALGRDDPKARDYTTKIDEKEFRKQAQTWIDWGLATRAIKNKKTEAALALARTGELSHIQKVWIFTQSAKLLAQTDRDQALSLVEESAAEARRIDGSELDRPRGFLAIANAVSLIEPSRLGEAVFDAVKAANSTENFKGEDAVLTLKVTTRNQVWKKFDAVAEFDLESVFRDAANIDFERAVELARGFREEAPRANATITICRTVLNEKKTPLVPLTTTSKN